LSDVSYDVTEDGRIERFGPDPIGRIVAEGEFQTGNAELDDMLRSARAKFLDRDHVIRRESLEKLWDAWERLKTIEPGEDKKEQTTALLSRLPVSQEFRVLVEREAKELTEIGNNFRIRHSETNRQEITNDTEVDYLFYRMFSLIWLLLSGTGRASISKLG
jgi:hypothetical protein